nr:hypothetical protein [Actinomycetota bacterium]
MTQDQFGQARGAGYGDAVEDETDEYSAEGSKPMTRFQKVASALRGDRPDRDEADDEAGQEATDPGLTAGSGTAVDSGPATGTDVMAGPDAAGPDTARSDAIRSDATRSDVMADPGLAAGTDMAAESTVRPDGQASPPWTTGSRPTGSRPTGSRPT